MTTEHVLTGDLTFLSLADLLQLLGGNGSSGILRLHSPHSPEPGLVYFQNGNPVHALAPGRQGVEALYALFGWVDGQYTFSLETFRADATIKQSRMEIILDGLRKLDDGELPKLGSAPDGGADPSARVRSTDFTVMRGPLVDYMSVVDEEQFPAGREIVAEGSHGNWIWVILEGQVELFRQTPEGPLKLLTLGEGAFVGSVAAFSMGGHMRSATCVAGTDVVLGVLDQQRLATEYTRMSVEMRLLAQSLDRRLKELTDRVVEFSLGPPDPQRFVEGRKPVLNQGDADEKLYRITQGEATVVRQRDRIVCPLARLTTNDVFGRIPFADLGQEPSSAMVLGDASLEVTPLDVAALQAEFEGLSISIKNLFENLVRASAMTARMALQRCGGA